MARLIHPWALARALMLIGLLAASLLVAACSESSTAENAPTATPAPTATITPAPTATPAPTCASALPGAGSINLGASGFVYPIAFPPHTVGTAPALVVAGAGLFTGYSFNACTSSTTTNGVTSFFGSTLPSLQHGWIPSTTYPADGGLMTPCSAPCFYDPKGGPFYYLVFDQFHDHGGGIVTYRARWSVSPDFPTCGSNFTSGAPAQQDVFFLPNQSPAVPLPPLSSTVPDDASGGLRGFDVCSPGTTASISAFMTKELPATGWHQIAGTSNPACFYTSQCWQHGSAVISWAVAGFTADDWHIAWRVPLP